MDDDPDMTRMRATWDDIQRERDRRVNNASTILVAVLCRDVTPRTGWRIWRITRRNPRLTVIFRP